MSWDVRQITLFIHILLGIIWFGGILFVGWGVFPASRTLKPSNQRTFLRALMKWVHWPLTLAGMGVILSGILLGTVLGPLNSWKAIAATAYGQLFATAFIVATLTLLWGTFISYRHAMKVFSKTELWHNADQGYTKPLKRALINMTAVESVEVAGLLIVLTCMILI